MNKDWANSSPSSFWYRGAGIAIASLALLILPFVLESVLGRAWVRTIDIALLFALLAIGLNIVVGYAGLLDLGFIAFFGVGAYVYALLASPHFGLHYPFWVLLPLGALVAAFFGALLGYPTLKLHGDYLAIVTLGFGEIIRIFLVNLNRPFNLTNGPHGITQIDPLVLGSWNLGRTWHIEWLNLEIAPVHAYYYVFLLCVILVLGAALRLERSRIGRAWMAIREDEVAASAMGINTRKLKLLAFATGAASGGCAGGLFSAFQGFVSPESFKLMDSVMVLCMVVLGGMGNAKGAVLGALLLVILPESLRYVSSQLGQSWLDPSDLRMLLFGLAMVLMMRFRPVGLWSAYSPPKNTSKTP